MLCNIEDKIGTMIKIILDEGTLVAKDHRGTIVAKVSMPIGSSSIIYVRRYRKSFRVTLNGIVLWNVASCVWAGNEENMPQVTKELAQEEDSELIPENFKVLYLPR